MSEKLYQLLFIHYQLHFIYGLIFQVKVNLEEELKRVNIKKYVIKISQYVCKPRAIF